MACNINANLLSRSERSDLFFDALPSGYQLFSKDNHFIYIDNRDCARQKLDHIVASNVLSLFWMINTLDSFFIMLRVINLLSYFCFCLYDLLCNFSG